MKKRLISLLLTVAMLLPLVVVPTNAALVAGTGTLTITPNVTSVPGSASAPIEVIYTIKVTPPAEGPVGEFHFNLKAPDGMTLSEVKLKPQAGNKGGDGYWVNMNDLWYNPTTEEGIFETFEYTPSSKYFQAFGTSATRNMTAEADIMTIKATIAAGKTGNFTLDAENVGINKDGTDSYSVDVKTTPVTVVSSISGNLPVTIAKPVVNQAPVTTLTDTRYSGTITWDPAVTSGGKFAASTVYTANVTLTANTGYQFADDVNPTVTDATISNKSVSADGAKLTFKAKFAITGSLPPASVTAAPTANTGLKYDGTEHVLLGFVGTANGGTMQYSLDNSTWSKDIPKGTNAGNYTVYYKVKGDSGHSDYTPASNTVTVKIDPKGITSVTIDSIPKQTYTGNAITPDPEVKDGTKTLVKGTDYTVSCTNKYVGTATLTITGKGNYTGETTANFTIVAADQNPSFTTPVDLVTGGHRLNLTTLVNGAKGNMTFTITSGTAATLETGNTLVSTGITGVVKIRVSIAAKDVDSDGTNEYNAFSKSEAITVNVVDKTPDTTTLKVSQGNITYGGSVAPSVTNKPADAGTVSYTYEGRDGTTYSSSATAPTNVGKYKVKATCESSTTIYTAEDTFEIQAKSISGMTVTLDKTSLEYNGSAQTVTVTVKDGITTLSSGTDYTVTGTTSSTNVGSYTVTVTGKGNYTGSVEKTWKITQGTPTYTVPTGLTATFGQTLANVNIAATTGWSWMDSTQPVGDASTTPKTFKAKFTPADITNYKTVENIDVPVTVNKKAAITNLPDIKHNLLYTTTSTQFANVGRAGMPEDAGTLTYARGAAPMLFSVIPGTPAVVSVADWNVDLATGTVEYRLNPGSVGEKVRFPVDISSTNYEKSTVFVEIRLIDKNNVSDKITFPDGKLVYKGDSQNHKYENATISIAASGTANWTYTYLPITGTTANLNTDNLPQTVGKYTVIATYEDDTQFGTKSATLEITQATPTVTPKFDKITEKDKTLADTHLTIASSSLTGGKIEWVDGSDNVLPGNTKVEANKAYKWKYTPALADAVNYAPVYGTIVVYPVSTGIVIYSPCYTIKASAGVNGTISPAGWCSVVENGSQTFTFTPDKGYTVAKVLVDGKSVGAVKSYTFKNVTKDHTIEVIFMKSNGNPATGAFVMP